MGELSRRDLFLHTAHTLFSVAGMNIGNSVAQRPNSQAVFASRNELSKYLTSFFSESYKFYDDNWSDDSYWLRHQFRIPELRKRFYGDLKYRREVMNFFSDGSIPCLEFREDRHSIAFEEAGREGVKLLEEIGY